MSPWLVAIGAGCVFALLQYGWRRTHRGPLWMTAALLRVVVVTLVTALLLDAPAGRAVATRPWVVLDGSQSMSRGDTALWRAAIDSVRRIGPESTLVFGDSIRVLSPGATPIDRQSSLRGVGDRAQAAGYSAVLITDGETTEPEAISAFPAGSRVVVLRRAATPDAAIVALDLPRAVVSGDTTSFVVQVASGNSGSRRGRLRVLVDGREVAQTALDSLPPFASNRVEVRARIDGLPGPALVQAIATTDGDRTPQNDTLSVAIDRSRSASAVFVTTSPDFDSRAAIGLLRGALSLPARGYLRVAPGVWRIDGTLAPVTEADVRAALRDAPIVIIHGDTTVLGSPATITAAPYAVMIPVQDTTTEWYVSAAPISPLSPAYTGIAWDSLPPLLVNGPIPKGMWTGLTAKAARLGDARSIVIGRDTPRRSVIVAGSGFWRWQFRGGRSADAFAAFWGAIVDWLAGEKADKRSAIPDASFFRSGEQIRWRRGSAADSVVSIVVRRRNGGARADSMMLRFAAGATVVESPPLTPGLYDVTTTGGPSVLVVDASSEWIPRAPTLHTGPIHGGSLAGEMPALRDWTWLYVVIVGALCAEWLIRRRIGMR